MEKEKIDQFMMANAKFFPPMMVGQIKDKLATLGEDKETMLISTDWKNPTVGFLFAFFLGGFGADRFWLGDTGLAVVKLITCGWRHRSRSVVDDWRFQAVDVKQWR